jgi:hypothetical protein
MQAAGTGLHLHADERRGSKRCPNPNAQVGPDVFCGTRYPTRLRYGSQDSESRRGCERRGPVSTKLGAAGHLPPHAAYVAERFVQVVHGTLRYKASLLCNIKRVKSFLTFGYRRYEAL